MYDTAKWEDRSLVSVFEINLTHPLNKSTIHLARNSSYRVLPCLASALEFGGASLSSSNSERTVAPDDYGSIIVAPLVKLFASAYRVTRIALLDSLPDFAEKLDKKTVCKPGFTDTVAVFLRAYFCVRCMPGVCQSLSPTHFSSSFRNLLCLPVVRHPQPREPQASWFKHLAGAD